ncbi:nucleotide exchange factor GrpE, partial [Paenibacillus sp. TAF58]
LSSSKETKDFDALVKGLDMTYRGIDQLLTAEGLKPIDSVGQPFNPEFHQAVMQVESEEHEEGIVVEELQKGYILKDKVIRPAMVKVSL